MKKNLRCAFCGELIPAISSEFYYDERWHQTSLWRASVTVYGNH